MTKVTDSPKQSPDILKNVRAAYEALEWLADSPTQRAFDNAEQALSTRDETLAALEGIQWQPIDSAPKDGTEIIVIYPHCGNVAQLVYFNTIHKYWCNKGTPELGLENQGCLWQHKPAPPTHRTQQGG